MKKRKKKIVNWKNTPSEEMRFIGYVLSKMGVEFSYNRLQNIIGRLAGCVIDVYINDKHVKLVYTNDELLAGTENECLFKFSKSVYPIFKLSQDDLISEDILNKRLNNLYFLCRKPIKQ